MLDIYNRIALLIDSGVLGAFDISEKLISFIDNFDDNNVPDISLLYTLSDMTVPEGTKFIYNMYNNLKFEYTFIGISVELKEYHNLHLNIFFRQKDGLVYRWLMQILTGGLEIASQIIKPDISPVIEDVKCVTTYTCNGYSINRDNLCTR